VLRGEGGAERRRAGARLLGDGEERAAQPQPSQAGRVRGGLAVLAARREQLAHAEQLDGAGRVLDRRREEGRVAGDQGGAARAAERPPVRGARRRHRKEGPDLCRVRAAPVRRVRRDAHADAHAGGRDELELHQVGDGGGDGRQRDEGGGELARGGGRPLGGLDVLVEPLQRL